MSCDFLALAQPGVQKLSPYVPGKPVDELARELNLDPAGIVKLASNENPLGPSPKALAAIQAELSELTRYPDGNGFVLKQRLAQRYSVGVHQVTLGNGSNDILELVARAYLAPGLNAVFSEHAFAVYPIATQAVGAEGRAVAAKNWGHDLDAMADAIDENTRVVFVANPNNPTGTIASGEEIAQLIDQLPPDVLLVMDEAYFEYQEDGPDLPPLIRSSKHPNLTLMRTFSTIYGLAGLRVGYGVGDPEFVEALEKVRQPFNLNAMAQAAALAALDDEQHLSESRDQNRKGSIFLGILFKRSGIELLRSHANFLLVKVPDGAQVAGEMERLGVIVRSLKGYDLPEWIRVTLGTDKENQRCHQALCQVLDLPEE